VQPLRQRPGGPRCHRRTAPHAPGGDMSTLQNRVFTRDSRPRACDNRRSDRPSLRYSSEFRAHDLFASPRHFKMTPHHPAPSATVVVEVRLVSQADLESTGRDVRTREDVCGRDGRGNL
jgi:hypothetical protein